MTWLKIVLGKLLETCRRLLYICCGTFVLSGGVNRAKYHHQARNDNEKKVLDKSCLSVGKPKQTKKPLGKVLKLQQNIVLSIDYEGESGKCKRRIMKWKSLCLS